MRKTHFVSWLLTGVAGIALATPAVAAGTACANLAALARPDLKIIRAVEMPAGTLPQDNPSRAALTGAARASAALPAHCVVDAMIAPRVGVDGASYATGIQLRLPELWNGKLLFQGGGGVDGVINEAIGPTPFAGSTAKPALNRGYAVVTTDSGHQGKNSSDATFGVDQQARVDHAYAAIGTTMREARDLVTARYGEPAKRAYYLGCSNGGRTALMAAQRFSTLFDGIVAGNPGFRLSRAAIAQAWDVAALNAAAPKDADGKPILAQALTPGDMNLVKDAVLAACDAKDGLKDGMISAPSACSFDPVVLQCAGAKTDTCLSSTQIKALKTVFDGARTSKGEKIYASWPYDTGIATPEWRGWKLGTSTTAVPNARNATLGVDSLSKYFVTPPDPMLTQEKVDFDTIVGRTAQTAAINDAIATQLSTYAAHGGKLVVVHGNSDPVFSPDDLTGWWQELAADNGGAAHLADTARLYMVPGMTHCGGGLGLDDIDPLTALEAWVETGTAPDRLVAKGKAFPGRTRPLCPYPQEAHYRGAGDPESEASFECR